jgi:hypothetical protein
MFYGNINESVLQEGKILDFIKRIFKKKNKNVKDKDKYINQKINGCSIFKLPVYIYINEKDKDKIPEIEERCKKDVQIINTHEDEALEKCVKYYNEYLTDIAQKGEEFEKLEKSDIYFGDCVYFASSGGGYYSFSVYADRDYHPYSNSYITCDIRVSENGELKYDIFTLD